MFTLLVIALVVAVLIEKNTEIISDQEQLLSENTIENIVLNNDKVE